MIILFLIFFFWSKCKKFDFVYFLVTARPSPPRRPPPPVPSTSPSREQAKIEVKQEQPEDSTNQQPRGIRRDSEDESLQSRSIRRRLIVERNFEHLRPDYFPFVAEYAAQRIGCSLLPRPLTPERPATSSSQTQTSPSPLITVNSCSTTMTPPASPPAGAAAAAAGSPPERPPPPRIVGRRSIAVMSTMPRPRPICSVLRGTTPARPPPPVVRRPPSAALGAPPRNGDGNSEEMEEEEEEGELPDLPEDRHSPAVSDITIVRLV